MTPIEANILALKAALNAAARRVHELAHRNVFGEPFERCDQPECCEARRLLLFNPRYEPADASLQGRMTAEDIDQPLSTAEDIAWMESDLSDMADVEPYEWGPAGPPPGNPVRYVPGVGLVIDGKPNDAALNAAARRVHELTHEWLHGVPFERCPSKDCADARRLLT